MNVHLLLWTQIVLAHVEEVTRPDTAANARGSVRLATAIFEADNLALVDREESIVCLGQLASGNFPLKR